MVAFLGRRKCEKNAMMLLCEGSSVICVPWNSYSWLRYQYRVLSWVRGEQKCSWK